MPAPPPQRSLSHAVYVGVLWCGVAAACCTVPCHAQVAPEELPEMPLEHSGVIHGSVTDQDGSLLPGARVQIVSERDSQVEIADSDGEFRVTGLPAGLYEIRVLDSGFASIDETVALLEGEEKDLPPIELHMMEARADVTVVASVHEVAAAQVAGEVKQRVFGVIPNFYVVYEPNPAPLSKGQKAHLALLSTFDPISFLGVAVNAGIEQASDEFPGYGQGAMGYAKRYGAGFADGAVAGFLGGMILPIIFRQDPRYYYQGTGTVWSRTKHAVGSVALARGDNGKLEFNYSNVLGNFAAAGISNIYYPSTDRHGVGLTLQNAAVGTAFEAFAAVMQEFVVRKLTPRLPSLKISPGNTQ